MAARRDTRDARETLEPMLDDLARGLGYDRALVFEYDAARSELRGLFGLNIKDEQVRDLTVALSRTSDPIVMAYRTGAPQLIDDVSADARLDLAERDALLRMNIQRFVAAAVPGVGADRTNTVVVRARGREIRDTHRGRHMPGARPAGHVPRPIPPRGGDRGADRRRFRRRGRVAWRRSRAARADSPGNPRPSARFGFVQRRLARSRGPSRR